jgi:chromosomal replication initiation ATPase DnaA
MTAYSFPGLRPDDRRIYNLGPDPMGSFVKRRKKLVNAITSATGFTIRDIRSKRRTPPLPWLRAIISWYLYVPNVISFKMIGKFLKLDHSSVVYYIKTLVPNLEKNKEFQQLLNSVRRYL